jgi:glucokinase
MQEAKEYELPVLALDIGGTKINAAVISNKGQVLTEKYRLTLADEGPRSVINQVFSIIDSILKQEDKNASCLSGISLAVAGAIDSRKGIITASPNLLGWHDIPLRDIVKKRYRVDTFLINDANAAALGEHCFGVGWGVNNLILLTLGTGIGGGIIINGKLYSGQNGSAGEIGHMTIDINGPKCKCGNTGCLEVLASGTAVTEAAVRRISRGEKSTITDIVKGKIEDITAEKISIAAQRGDALASEVIFKAATYLGVGMVNLVNIFNPEMIIVGGGMVKMGDLLLNPARQVVKRRAFKLPAQEVRIVPAQLGNNAGVFGAAVFVFQKKQAGE